MKMKKRPWTVDRGRRREELVALGGGWWLSLMGDGPKQRPANGHCACPDAIASAQRFSSTFTRSLSPSLSPLRPTHMFADANVTLPPRNISLPEHHFQGKSVLLFSNKKSSSASSRPLHLTAVPFRQPASFARLLYSALFLVSLAVPHLRPIVTPAS